MLTVISSAKTLDYESDRSQLPVKKNSQPIFKSDSAELIELLRQYTPAKLAGLMNISEKLANLNVDRYENWELKPTQSNARQAIFAFKGDVYLGLNASTMNQTDCEFAQSRLRILSGLYGALRPLDLMQPYRLEMGTKLNNDRGSNLYDFWGERVTAALNKQIKKNGDQALVNLASNEYFKVVKPAALDVRVIAPVFKDEKNGKYKIISFYAKKARGMMAGWMIRNQITDVAALKKFSEAGYRYNAGESSLEAPVFLRKEVSSQ